MTMQGLDDVHAAVMAGIRELYSQTVFDLWFGDLHLISLDDKEAVFKINSDFKQGILQKKYADVLKKAGVDP